MILMCLFAVICAFAAITVISPIARDHRRTSFFLMMFIPFAALGLYMIFGAPGVPSRPAAFETNAEILDARAVVKRELDTLKELSQTPEDQTLIMRLAGLKMSQGKFDEAADLLEKSIVKFPENTQLKMQLAAAYYTKAMILLEGKEFAQSYRIFQKAKDIAPPETPFLEDINTIIPELKKLL